MLAKAAGTDENSSENSLDQHCSHTWLGAWLGAAFLCGFYTSYNFLTLLGQISCLQKISQGWTVSSWTLLDFYGRSAFVFGSQFSHSGNQNTRLVNDSL